MAPFVDPNTLHELIVGAASNGIWSFLAHAGGKAFKALKNTPATSVADVYTVAAATVCKEFCSAGSSEWSRLNGFLTSPEVESIVRQIYAASIVGKGQERHIEAIKDEFVISLAIYIDVSVQAAEPVAGSIFIAIFRECENQLSNAVSQNVLSAHEAKSSARYMRLLGEIAAVKKNLDFLRAEAKPDVAAFILFEERYRAQVGSRHWFIQPPHLETARKVAIDELYVTPTFVSVPTRKRAESQQVSLDEFLATAHRAVLLGNPGGGKSTFALKLCHDLAAKYDKRIFRQQLVTPILVILREYGGQKKTDHCSILQFIESQSASRYQLPVPPGAFEYLLLNGRVIVEFDGLDELLDTSYRQEISNDVESFCNLYPSVPVLVTSREVGYEQAPLDPKQFQLLKIAPFDDEQISAYVTKWFARDEDLPRPQRDRKAKAFLSESELAPDLRTNPLMLGLMCNLYHVDGYIPRNRPEIYEKCALMLFERWDKSRGIAVPLPFDVHIRPAMQHLAHWIYSQDSLQGGVKRGVLVEETAAYLNRWVFEDLHIATKAADDFIEFCTGRAWVFTDTGTTAEGEKLYQFTHRTFLEYFTAAYLFSTHPTPEQLGELLKPRIAKQEWDVVALLAYQIQSRRVQGAADKLLAGLLEVAIQLSRDERWDTLLFAARCLESIVPSPAVRRAVISASIRACVSLEFPDRIRPGEEGPGPMIAAILSTSPENQATAGEAVEQILSWTIESESPKLAAAAYEIAAWFNESIYRARGSAPSDAFQFWSHVGRRIMVGCLPHIERVAARSLLVASTAFDAGDISLPQVVGWHGVTGLFTPPRSPLFQYWKTPIAIRLLRRMGRSDGVGDDKLQPALEDLGQALISTEPPWVEVLDKIRTPEFHVFINDLLRTRPAGPDIDLTLGPKSRFAIFAVLAAVAEAREDRSKRELLAWLGRFDSPSMASTLSAVRSRFDPGTSGLGLQLGPPYDEFITRWASSQISLVDLPGSPAKGEDSEGSSDQAALPLAEEDDEVD